MKLVLFDDYQPGLLHDDEVVDISNDVPIGVSGQETMENIIVNWERLANSLEGLLTKGPPRQLSDVRLRAPLPRPKNVLGMRVNYREGASDGGPLRAFAVTSSAIVGPGGTTVLPQFEFIGCRHEAELVCVIGKSARDVKVEDALDYVFGYTAGVDIGISHKADWGPFGKSCDGFKPIGPCIVTKSDIPDPQNLRVRFSVDGELRQDYNTADMAHPVKEVVSWLSSFIALSPGDVIFMGTNHQQVGPLQDGDNAVIDIEKIGSFTFNIADPLKRSWPKVLRNELGPVSWQNPLGNASV